MEGSVIDLSRYRLERAKFHVAIELSHLNDYTMFIGTIKV